MNNEKIEIGIKVLRGMKLSKEEFYKSLSYNMWDSDKGFVDIAKEFDTDLYGAYLLTCYEDNDIQAYINFDKNPDKNVVHYGISMYNVKEEFLSDNQKKLIEKYKNEVD